MAVVMAVGSLAGPPARGAVAAGDLSFDGRIDRIGAELRARMRGVSWRPACPVRPRDLRVLTMGYWSFDGEVHRGRLVVHEDVAGEVLGAFRRLFRARFAIKQVRLVEAYGADDRRLMRANVTSAFNCRTVTGGDAWSQHAFGLAVDINPVQNPYVDGSTVLPQRGRRYLDRSLVEPGMIHGGDVVVRAFRRIGWGWGGTWSSPRDYMHLSATGG